MTARAWPEGSKVGLGYCHGVLVSICLNWAKGFAMVRLTQCTDNNPSGQSLSQSKRPTCWTPTQWGQPNGSHAWPTGGKLGLG